MFTGPVCESSAKGFLGPMCSAKGKLWSAQDSRKAAKGFAKADMEYNIVEPSFRPLLNWVQSCCMTTASVFNQWKSVTAAAFNATPACPCSVFLDQAELLVNREVEGLSQLGGRKSVFTEILSRFPQRMGMFSAGTVNILQDRPSEQYTVLKVHEVPALAPLSLQAARRAMKEWSGYAVPGGEIQQSSPLLCRGTPAFGGSFPDIN
ncbi:unnamed protein product [Effrenium voratum]|nr:unnamed protein product [Effrenium voratum]